MGAGWGGTVRLRSPSFNQEDMAACVTRGAQMRSLLTTFSVSVSSGSSRLVSPSSFPSAVYLRPKQRGRVDPGCARQNRNGAEAKIGTGFIGWAEVQVFKLPRREASWRELGTCEATRTGGLRSATEGVRGRQTRAEEGSRRGGREDDALGVQGLGALWRWTGFSGFRQRGACLTAMRSSR
jgi:hypothetical protein